MLLEWGKRETSGNEIGNDRVCWKRGVVFFGKLKKREPSPSGLPPEFAFSGRLFDASELGERLLIGDLGLV